MLINSARFGEIEIDDEKTIFFEKGLPGLEKLKKFIFLTPENTYPFFFLQSLEEPNVSLPVINPFDVIKDYNPSVSESILEELGLEDVQDLLLLNVVVIPKNIERMTVNMSAPIIINVKKFKGRQVILDDNQYSIRHPLYETFISLRNGGC